jgi:hypothetical protein
MQMSNLSRRSLVASAAALPALALPVVAVAAEPDPIFAAIERWEKAAAIEQAAYDVRDAAHEAFRERHGTVHPSGGGDRTLNIQTDDYENNVVPQYEAADEAADVRLGATRAVFAIVPTTLAGLRAKIDFAFSVDYVTGLLTNTGSDEPLRNFIDTLYASARLMAQA